MAPADDLEDGTASWQALYLRLEKPLFNLAYRYTWNRDEAEDVVHDAFLKVWDRRARLRRDTADRYLWVTTLNVARQRRRWRRVKEFLQIEPDQLADPHSPERALDSTQLQAQLVRAIDALPEKLRTALLLAEFSELSYEAAAQLLAIPAGTFASRRNSAIRKLTQVMNHERSK